MQKDQYHAFFKALMTGLFIGISAASLPFFYRSKKFQEAVI